MIQASEAMKMICKGDIQLLISLSDSWEAYHSISQQMRRLAIEHRCLCLTNTKVALQVMPLLNRNDLAYNIYDMSLDMRLPIAIS